MAKAEPNKAKNTKKLKKKKLERLYEKKPIVEFIVAVLSIPSILLLLLLNLKSLTNTSNAKPTVTPTISEVSVPGTNSSFYSRPVTREPKPTLLPNETQAPCIKGLGPVSIISPDEGDTITTNPVEVDISYDDSKYCSAVWSYSVNGSNWSDYNNNSIALYNLPNGPISFQLRVKSLTNSSTTTLTRNFSYQGQSTAPTTASGSGTTH